MKRLQFHNKNIKMKNNLTTKIIFNYFNAKNGQKMNFKNFTVIAYLKTGFNELSFQYFSYFFYLKKHDLCVLA